MEAFLPGLIRSEGKNRQRTKFTVYSVLFFLLFLLSATLWCGPATALTVSILFSLLMAKEQYMGAEQINKAIQQLDQVIQQNASASEELASTSEELSSQAEQLQDAVAFFKINGAGASEKKD